MTYPISTAACKPTRQQSEISRCQLDNGFPANTVNAPELALMSACPTCGCAPCINPDFCRACRDAGRRKAHGQPPLYIEASRWRGAADHIPRNWNKISLEALIAHFDGARRRSGAPRATVEALMFSLREAGTKAPEKAATKRRLGDLSDLQAIEVGNRLQRLKPEIARAWSSAEVEILFEARIANAR